MPFWLQLFSNTVFAGIAVAVVNAYFKSREPFQALEARRRDDHLREEARVHSDYLRPLRGATRELLDRLTWYHEALAKDAPVESRNRVEHLRSSVKRLKDTEDRDHPEAYLLFCNGEGVDGVDGMYVFARYFTLATKTRTALPTIEWALGRSCEDLRTALIVVENAFNAGGYGIYETVQRSMCQYLLGPDGHPKAYAAFCELLAGKTSYPHFLILFDFLIQLDQKRDYQVADALKALPRVEELVVALSEARLLLAGGPPSR